MSTLPPPLTDPDVDLRGMPYMPLDLHRLFESDFYALATGEEFKAALTLWGKSFYQIPAGSLPSDERLLAHLSGTKCWAEVKDMALHGWVKCADGRLYHATVAEKVAEAWEARLIRRARTQAARAAKAKAETGEAGGTNMVGSTVTEAATNAAVEAAINVVTEVGTASVTNIVTEAGTELVTASKGTEQKGREQNRTEDKANNNTAPRRCGLVGDEFEQFWKLYPRRVGKGQARRAFAGAMKKTSLPTLLAALHAYDFDPRERFQPYPATWLNGERWLDETMQQDPVLRAAGVGVVDEKSADSIMSLLQ